MYKSKTVHSFFLPTDRPTITRDGAMGNETFFWDSLIRTPVNIFRAEKRNEHA